MSASAEPVVVHDVAGQALRVRRSSGDGRSLLICGDFMVNLEIFDDFCAQMSRPCVVFDWPGIGAPGAAPMQRMPALADVLTGLLDSLDLERVDLLGMGWGGLLAQQFAYNHAERLARLVLVATSAGPIMLPGRLGHLGRLARRNGLQELVVDGRAARALFGGRREVECQAVADALTRARAPSMRAVAAHLYALTGFTSLTWAHRIKAPTLILAGDDDRIVPLVNARLLGLLIARAELSVMHAAGHWLLIERQAEAIQRIEAFLALGDTRRRPDDE